MIIEVLGIATLLMVASFFTKYPGGFISAAGLLMSLVGFAIATQNVLQQMVAINIIVMGLILAALGQVVRAIRSTKQ